MGLLNRRRFISSMPMVLAGFPVGMGFAVSVLQLTAIAWDSQDLLIVPLGVLLTIFSLGAAHFLNKRIDERTGSRPRNWTPLITSWMFGVGLGTIFISIL